MLDHRELVGADGGAEDRVEHVLVEEPERVVGFVSARIRAFEVDPVLAVVPEPQDLRPELAAEHHQP